MNDFESLREQVLKAYSADGSPTSFSPQDALDAADFFEAKQELPLAASALDRAFGMDSSISGLVQRRKELLRSLSVVEHGILFRYVPAGSFLIGSQSGDRDERPVHPVQLDGFWISETPITWAGFTNLMDWTPPPESLPKEPFDENDKEARMRMFGLIHQNRLRLQYCESDTKAAKDWHAHRPEDVWSSGETSEEIFGKVDRGGSTRPFHYDSKPMVAVAHQDGTQLATKISNDQVQYRLPTEAEWEKAARGGLMGCRFSWGDDRPSHDICDFGHFGEFYIGEPKSFPPNGYGLYGMCGGVWEWTCDPYDALAYSEIATQPAQDQQRPSLVRRMANKIHANLSAPVGARESENDRLIEHVVRGGAWSDCAEACTVSFRKSLASYAWNEEISRGVRHDGYLGNGTPNVGFRLVRITKPS